MHISPKLLNLILQKKFERHLYPFENCNYKCVSVSPITRLKLSSSNTKWQNKTSVAISSHLNCIKQVTRLELRYDNVLADLL